jgi:hypothetical protein
MSDDVLLLALPHLRATDSNSLLRMYDEANGILNNSQSLQQRLRADRALQRIAKELEKRNVSL